MKYYAYIGKEAQMLLRELAKREGRTMSRTAYLALAYYAHKVHGSPLSVYTRESLNLAEEAPHG